MPGYVDKLLGRYRDAGGSGTINFGDIIQSGDVSEFNAAINSILQQIAALNYEVGAPVTVEQINNYTSILNNLQSLFTTINEMDGVSQEFKDYFETLITNLATAINGLTVGDTFIQELYDTFASYFTEISQVLQELSEVTANNELRQYIESVVNDYLSTTASAETVLIDGKITYKDGLSYLSTDLVYMILGQKRTSIGRKLTCEAADPNFGRIDAFVADLFGNTYIIKGDASENPIMPVIPYNVLYITHAIIPANAVVPSNVTVEVIYDELAAGEWTPSSTADDGVTINTSAETAPATGAKHISIVAGIPDTTPSARQHYIGEAYGGGVIFYLSEDGKSGLIAAPSDVSRSARYQGSTNVQNGTQNNVGIGFGSINTAAMMAIPDSNQAGMAAPLCHYLISGGFSDWFLPSRGELDLMRFYKNLIGGFAAVNYWSSTEAVTDSDKYAYGINFADASGWTKLKKTDYRAVRAVRAFDDANLVADKPATTFVPANTKVQFAAPAIKSIVNGTLTLELASSLPWLSDSALLIESWANGVKTGGVLLQKVNAFGFVSSITDYQQAAIPMNSLGANITEIDALTIRMLNTWPNGIELKFDNIRIQYDANQAQSKKLGTLAYVNHRLLSQAEYDALPAKDDNTIYFIPEE